MTAIQLIVGLGNPGPEYDQTRHNAGALFVERLADSQRVSLALDKKYFGLVGKFSHQGRDVRLLIPTTYMNRSGQAVAALAGFFRIPVEAILVAHDELDMLPGTARLKVGGGHGGQVFSRVVVGQRKGVQPAGGAQTDDCGDGKLPVAAVSGMDVEVICGHNQ